MMPGDGGLAIRARLQFSQASQATPSQALAGALREFNLADASQCTQPGGDVCMSQDVPAPSQLPLQPSQMLNIGSQDFLTPAEQQFDTEPAVGGKKMRSPAKLTPQGKKRQRSSLPARFAPGSQALSQGLSQQAAPSRTSALHSPRCTHNIFSNRPAAQPAAASSVRRLPTVSMYREVYKELKQLGTGNFSRVYQVRSRVDGLEYAVKRSQHPVPDNSALLAQWLQEVQAMAAAGSHPNVVRYYAAWLEDAPGGGVHVYVQMEPCRATLAERFCVERQPLREAELTDILRQMAGALAHLHDLGIAHMDVKPDNIYLTDEGVLKLGDFGLATRSNGEAGVAEEGDKRYVAQEVLNANYARLDKADMWALGASLYQLATGRDLPDGGDQYTRLREGKLTLIPGCNGAFQAVLARLMAKNPLERPSARELLAGRLLNKPPENPALGLLG